MSIEKREIEIKPYNIKELAAIYEMNPRTFSVWLNKLKHHIGEKKGRYFDVNQVETIIKLLGIPGKTTKEAA
jgi:hypothetical protein